MQFIDSAMLTTLAGFSAISSPQDRTRWDPFLESFVFGELLKHTTAENDYQIFYYRDHDKVEVDYVVENAAGLLIGVEVKAAATVKANDLKGIRRLAKNAEKNGLVALSFTMATTHCPLAGTSGPYRCRVCGAVWRADR